MTFQFLSDVSVSVRETLCALCIAIAQVMPCSRAGRKQMFAALMSQAPRFLHFHFKRVADIPLGEKVEFVCRWAGKHVDKYRRESHVQR